MKTLFSLLLVVGCHFSQAQKSMTTFILFRHAEKEMEGSKDPDLSQSGKSRSEVLVKLLDKVKVDAIYSTNFKRTYNTVAPLAKAHAITISNYEGMKMEEVDGMFAQFNGGTIVISGHSNTIPMMVNYLTGQKDEYKTFEDSDYGNLIIVTVTQLGKDAKVTWLRY